MAKRCMVLGQNGRIAFDYDMAIAEPFAQSEAVAPVDMWPAFEALAGFRESSGLGEALDALGDNPLPTLLIVTPAAANDAPLAQSLAEVALNARDCQICGNISTGDICPICQDPPDPKYRPFCSRRCADVDLNRWLSGAYAIPAAEGDGRAGRQLGRHRSARSYLWL